VASLNRVILIGNLTRDVELKFTPTGSPVANFGIAVNRSYKNKQGEKVDNTDFFNIVAWAKLAELCAEYISKGSPVAIEGRLQSRSWETDDGQKRSVVEVVAENVQFLSAGKRQEESTNDTPVEEIDLGDDIPF
jgi:single-strand DNA-binding protein